MTGRVRRFVEAAGRLDERFLGREVPDERPWSERLRRPRPAVWSRWGRVAYGVILLGMIAAITWLPQVIGLFAIVGLFAAALFVAAVDERRRRRQGSRN